MLKIFWYLKAEILEFCEKKGKYIPELSDGDWIADLAFAVDVTALTNAPGLLSLHLHCG